MKNLIFVIIISLTNLLLIQPTRSQNNLQSLIDRSSDNSTLNIPLGRYVSDKAINLSIKQSLTIIFAKGSEIYCSNLNTEVFVISECKNIKIVNGIFNHIKITQDQCEGVVFSLNSCDNISLEDCEINGCGIVGVQAYDSKNLTIKNCFIHDNRYSAYSFTPNCSGIKLISNRVENNPKFSQWDRNYSTMDIQDNTEKFAEIANPSDMKKLTGFYLQDHRNEISEYKYYVRIYNLGSDRPLGDGASAGSIKNNSTVQYIDNNFTPGRKSYISVEVGDNNLKFWYLDPGDEFRTFYGGYELKLFYIMK